MNQGPRTAELSIRRRACAESERERGMISQRCVTARYRHVELLPARARIPGFSAHWRTAFVLWNQWRRGWWHDDSSSSGCVATALPRVKFFFRDFGRSRVIYGTKVRLWSIEHRRINHLCLWEMTRTRYRGCLIADACYQFLDSFIECNRNERFNIRYKKNNNKV